jgi:hypothetical protein
LKCLENDNKTYKKENNLARDILIVIVCPRHCRILFDVLNKHKSISKAHKNTFSQILVDSK